MTTVKELKDWLDALDAAEEVFVDQGGLALETGSGAVYEVGGEPEEDD